MFYPRRPVSEEKNQSIKDHKNLKYRKLFYLLTLLLLVISCRNTQNFDLDIFEKFNSSKEGLNLELAEDTNFYKVTLWSKDPFISYDRDFPNGNYNFIVTRSGFVGIQILFEGKRSVYVSHFSQENMNDFQNHIESIIRTHEDGFIHGKNENFGRGEITFFGNTGEVNILFDLRFTGIKEPKELFEIKELFRNMVFEKPWILYNDAL